MQVKIVRIGNSQGIRIPSAILKQCGLKEEATLEVKEHSLVITPYEKLRQGWEESFCQMSKNKDDDLLDVGYVAHSYDEEWQW